MDLVSVSKSCGHPKVIHIAEVIMIAYKFITLLLISSYSVVEDTWFNFDTFLADLGDCDPSADYDTDSSDLFGPPSGFGFGSSSADCDTGSKKRSAGSLRVRLTLSLRVPRQCVSLSCRRAELRKLYIKAVQLRTLVRQNKARVTVTNRNTSASVVVPLTGDLDLRRGRLSMSCDPGSILVKEICGQYCEC